MSMKIEAIVFDLGGVLIHWDPRLVYRQIFNTEEEMDWFFEHICTFEWNEEQDAGRSLREATQTKILEYPQWAEHIKAYYGRWEEMLGGSIEQSVSLLNKIKTDQKYRLLALTNWSSETFPIALERYEFLQWFEGIVVSGEEFTRKPFPEIYKILFDRYQVNPSSAIFIDDNKRNVQAAQRLGMQVIHFKSPLQLEQELRNFHII